MTETAEKVGNGLGRSARRRKIDRADGQLSHEQIWNYRSIHFLYRFSVMFTVFKRRILISLVVILSEVTILVLITLRYKNIK